MNREQRENYHQENLRYVRTLSRLIQAQIRHKIDKARHELLPNTLRDLGVRKYGAYEYYRFYECTRCGTMYPELDGEIRMNGGAITRCPCLTPLKED